MFTGYGDSHYDERYFYDDLTQEVLEKRLIGRRIVRVKEAAVAGTIKIHARHQAPGVVREKGTHFPGCPLIIQDTPFLCICS